MFDNRALLFNEAVLSANRLGSGRRSSPVDGLTREEDIVSGLLEVESNYIQSHHEKLARQYPNKYLVIQGEKVHLACDDFDTAADEGAAILIGDFLVRHVDHPEDPVAFVPTMLGGFSDILEQGTSVERTRNTFRVHCSRD